MHSMGTACLHGRIPQRAAMEIKTIRAEKVEANGWKQKTMQTKKPGHSTGL